MHKHWKNFKSSMPFRIALLFTLFYLVCFSVGATVIYTNIQKRLNTQTNTLLERRHARIALIHQEGGIDAVTDMLGRTESDDPEAFGVGYKLVDPNNQVVFNTFTDSARLDEKPGFYDVENTTLGYGPDSPDFRFYSTRLGDHTLNIARNKMLSADLKSASKTGFLLTFLLTTIAALSGAMYLAQRSQARIKQIAAVMNEVGQGKLDTRLPVSRRDDDIDKLSKEMNTALTLLQRKIHGMTKVSFNIAHDLKTPMNRLYIRLDETISTLQEDDPTLPKLEAACNEAAQINSMFVTLLRIAQIESGSVSSEFKSVMLNDALQNAYEIYEVVAEENRQELILNLKSVNTVVHGAHDLLMQLIVNLIENAINHCPPGSKITLTAETLNGKALLHFCDNGPGIPAHERENVFDSLYRLEESRTTEGSGLGLTLVKAIADIHNATVELADNAPGLCVTVAFGAR